MRETQFLKVFANHSVLTLPQRAAHLVMSKISVGRNPKNPTTSFNNQNPTLPLMVQSQLTSFQNSQILETIVSGHGVIHTPTHFLSGSL